MRNFFLFVFLACFVLIASSVSAGPSSDEYSQMKEGFFLSDDATNQQKNASEVDFKALANANVRSVLSIEKLMADYKAGKYVEIFDAVKVKAEEDVPEAQELVGIMYSLGQGTDKHEVEALKWLTKTAEQELPVAQYYLGLLMSTGGTGVDKDMVEAIKWLKISSLLYKGEDVEMKNKIREAYTGVLKVANRRQKSEAIEKIRNWLKLKNKLDLFEKGGAPAGSSTEVTPQPAH